MASSVVVAPAHTLPTAVLSKTISRHVYRNFTRNNCSPRPSGWPYGRRTTSSRVIPRHSSSAAAIPLLLPLAVWSMTASAKAVRTDLSTASMSPRVILQPRPQRRAPLTLPPAALFATRHPAGCSHELVCRGDDRRAPLTPPLVHGNVPAPQGRSRREDDRCRPCSLLLVARPQ